MKKLLIAFTSVVFIISCNNSSTDTGGTDKKSAETSTSPAKEEKDPEAEKGLTLVAQSDCLTCHKLTEPFTGPAYADIAKKYKGEEGVIDSLAEKVIKGGSGVWGEIPMTPHPALSKEDAKAMIHYVLSVK